MRNNVLQIDKIYLLALLVITLDMFDYMPLANRLPTRAFMFLSIFYIIIRCSGNIRNVSKKGYFSKDMQLLLLGYSVTIIFSCIYWNQSVYGAVMANMPMITTVLLYFYFIRINLPEKTIIKTLVVCTIIWTALEWGQQLTYPSFWFCGRINENIGLIEERMGLMRFYITGVHMSIFVLIYYVCQFTQKNKRKKYNFLMWAIAFCGIIGFVSRKQIYASVLVSIIAFLLIKGRMRIFALLLLLCIAAYGIYNLAEIMKDLNEQTVTELNSDDFVRTLATHHFLFDFSDSPLYYLFGTGMADGNSSLGKTYTYLQEMYGYYIVDCGIFGYMARYGCINIILFMIPIYKMLWSWKKILLWHKLYLLYYGIMTNMAFWGNSTLGYLSFVLFLYLVDRHLQKRKYTKITTSIQ